MNIQKIWCIHHNDRMDNTWILTWWYTMLKHTSGYFYALLLVNSRNLTYLLSQSQTHWWRPVAWGSWTRWRGVCVVSVAGGWPLWRASSERTAWGTVSHWPAVSWCLSTSRQEVPILCLDSFVNLFSSFPAFCNINVINDASQSKSDPAGKTFRVLQLWL